MPTGTRANEPALLEQARAGDQSAFGQLVEAYRADLRAHCYRMLGSVHDADDALQDGLLRAWRGLPGFEGRSSVRSWLYAIVTRTALDITRHRSRRELPVDFGPAAPRGSVVQEFQPDLPWLEPYPDQWLTSTDRTPEARYEQRESIELAFVVALQQLPPLQRAVLILREVVGFSAAEIASQLSTTVAAVTSALQRARATMASRLPDASQQATLRVLGDTRVKALAGQYADAMERGDADALVALLTADATWSMPPTPTWFAGADNIREWAALEPMQLTWRHQVTTANAQLALGCYLPDQQTGRFGPAVLDILTLSGDKIACVTAFLLTDDQPEARQTNADLFASFGLPVWLD
jgi:RNA polymerase sigma-70 factor, ECF subfamily